MSDLATRVVEHVHGHTGFLAVAALLHPAIFLRRRKRRAVLSSALATVTATTAGALGAAIYPTYRAELKQRLFVSAPKIGWLFERKEHLAVAAIGLAWVGLVLHLAAPRFPAFSRSVAERTAHQAYVAAFLFALATALFGVVVATRTTF